MLSPAPSSDDKVVQRRDDAWVELERAEARLHSAQLQRSFALLRITATTLAIERPEVAEFWIEPSEFDVGRWYLTEFRDAGGRILDEGEQRTRRRITELLQEKPFVFRTGLLPADVVTYARPAGSIGLSVAALLALAPDRFGRLIDARLLSEEDFTMIWHAAEAQLGLLGSVRTRGDFIQQAAEHETLRENVTEAQLTLAAEVASARYLQEVEGTRFLTRVEPEIFVDAVNEAVDSLGLAEPADLPLAFHPPTAAPQTPDREH